MIKTISSFRCHPGWQLQFIAHITESKETAAAILKTWIDNICISLTGQMLQFKLGKVSYHIVFEGELVGVLLALHLLACQQRVCSVLITLDNQAAITVLQNNIPQTSHCLLDHIHDVILHIK